MTSKKSVTIISASPKLNEPSASKWLSERAGSLISDDRVIVTQINIRSSMKNMQTEQDFDKILASDALIFIFPLYFFCLPGFLMRYLQDYDAYYMKQKESAVKKTVFAIVNCGFAEADINEEAVRVIKSFSKKIDARFRFGLMIGGGGMLLGAQGAPFMNKTLVALDSAFSQMKDDIISDNDHPVKNIDAKANFPRRLYYFAGDRGWISSARKNGLKKKAIYAQPYV